MNNVIKRPKVGWESSDEGTRQSLENSILPLWYDEVQESNRFQYRLNSGVKGWISELSREQLLLLAQFSLHTSDITKPYYATQVQSPSDLTGSSRKKIGSLEDDLYDDVFRHAIRIKDLGEEYKEMYSTLKQNISSYKYIESADVDAADARTDIKAKLLGLLNVGEFFLGGELVSATSMGRVIDTTTGTVTSELERVVKEQIRDSGYFCLPLLTELSTLQFFDVNDNPIDLDPAAYILGFSAAESLYNPDFDIDQDGYVSEYDIDFIRQSIGKSLDNTTRDDWISIYHKLDSDNDSLISQRDVSIAELSLHGVQQKCILVKNPQQGYCKIQYEAFDEPYITYAGTNGVYRGGTFGYDMPEFNVDSRITDGLFTNSSDYVIGFNRAKGEIWTGRFVETQYELQKVSFAQQSKMTAVGMTVVDEVAFFLLESTVSGFTYFGSRYAILRVDTRKEKVEYSSDLLTFGVDLADDQFLTGIQSTERKDIFRVFTDTNEVITIKLIRNAVLSQAGDVFISQDSSIEPNHLEGHIRIYNDIDNFAFNFGMERLLFESNEDFIKRIETKGANPPNNSTQGMHDNYSLDMGFYKTILYRDLYLGTSNEIDVTKPVRIILQDAEFLTRYPSPIITLHQGTPVKKSRKYTKRVFINGAMHTMEDPSKEQIYWELESADWVDGKTIILRKDTMVRLGAFLLKGSVEYFKGIPNLDEDLVPFNDVSFRISYFTTDPDGVSHEAYDNYSFNIPSIDLSTYSEVREPGEVCQIPPGSKTAQWIPRTYTMTKGITKDYIGTSLWNDRIAKIRLGDTANWNKTIFGVTPFDDRFNSTYIVDKTYFNTGDFSTEQEEIFF